MTMWPSYAFVVVGFVGTLTMDVVGAVGTRIGTSHFLPIGRWLLYLLRGTVHHSDIAESPSVAGERVVTPFLHYAIGISLAGFYVASLGYLNLGSPSLLTATSYGVATSFLPYLTMFPSMGYGLFGMKGRPRFFLLRQSIVNHFAFGVGLWLGSLLLSRTYGA